MNSSHPTAPAATDELPAPAVSGRLTQARDTLLLIVALVACWYGLHLYVGENALPSPLATVEILGRLIVSPDFIGDVSETTRAFAYALAISLGGGLAIGVILGGHRLSGEVAEPMLVALYSIPKITLYPVILLLFGLGISAKIAFGALHGIIPVIIFTMNAVRNIQPVYLRSARVMRLTPITTARHVLLPACLPEIVAGFRVGFALTLLGTLIGEMFASQRGIGYLLVKAMESNEPGTIMALALLLVAFATLASGLLLMLDNRLHRGVQR